MSCAVFAAISGSSPVTMLAIGSVLLPPLLEQNYDRRFALGAVAAGGTLGILIPPSIPLIVFGIVTETPIHDLFVAAILPGMIVVVGLAGYAFWANRHVPARRVSMAEIGAALRSGIWAMLMPVLLIGGIYSGYFSPTEAAAVGLLYGVIIGVFVHRDLTFRDIANSLTDSARLLGMIVPIIAIAMSLKTLLTLQGAPQALTAFLTATVDSKIEFLLAMNLMLLVVGAFVDALAAILVLGPLLVVAGAAYGFDPVHLGIIIVLNLEIGFLTPPMGLNLIVASSAFKVRFKEMCRAVVPFLAVLLAVLMLVSFVPQISLALLGR